MPRALKPVNAGTSRLGEVVQLYPEKREVCERVADLDNGFNGAAGCGAVRENAAGGFYPLHAVNWPGRSDGKPGGSGNRPESAKRPYREPERWRRRLTISYAMRPSAMRFTWRATVMAQPTR